jgi:hypothetical protein
MPRTMTLLVAANRTVQSNEIRSAMVDAPAFGSIDVALVVPASGCGTRFL